MAAYTNNVFADLWRKTDLGPRDWNLITVAALTGQGQVAQWSFHWSRAMDSRLSQTQAGEVITHLAFYVGWPKAMSAVPVLKEVFEGRQSLG